MSRSLSKTLLSPRQFQCLTRCHQILPARNANDDTRPLSPQAVKRKHPQRPFSTSRPWRASGATRATRATARKPSQPSMAVQRKQHMDQALHDGTAMPDDVGLLPDTFIMPFRANRPSWLWDYKSRMKLERKRLSIRRYEIQGAFGYKFMTTRPRPQLRLKTIPGIAKDLHRAMYEHFGSGNLQPVELQICGGLLDSLRARIGERSANVTLRWTLHEYLTKPKLVSYKAAVVPNPKGSTSTGTTGVVQAVVRIHTSQSLQHVKRTQVKEKGVTFAKDIPVDVSGRELQSSGNQNTNAKEMVEYVVVQKMMLKSKEGSWMIWGMAEETTLDMLSREKKKEERKRKELQGKVAAASA